MVARTKKQRLSDCDMRCTKQKMFMRAETDVALCRGALAGVSNMQVGRFPRPISSRLNKAKHRPSSVGFDSRPLRAGGLAPRLVRLC
jgi:hypothetical protein